jgi:acyl-CoA synthetase (AMP-forming)/AMP-acid ligase II
LIGRPLAGNRVYVVNHRLHPVPKWAPGEVVLGGRGLSRGYLGRPGETARAFIPDPLSGEPGARLFRTGDLARQVEDGALEFLSRRDQRVKQQSANPWTSPPPSIQSPTAGQRTPESSTRVLPAQPRRMDSPTSPVR